MSDFDNPYAAPQSDMVPPASRSAAPHVESAGLWRDGKLMVVRIGQVSGIPKRCVKCNTPDDCKRMSLWLPYHHWIYFVFLLLTPIGYLYARRAVCYHYTVPLWVCKKHRFRHSLGLFGGGMAIFWPLIFLIGDGLLIALYESITDVKVPQLATQVTFAVGVAIWAAWGMLYLMFGRMVRVKKCHRNRFWLSGVTVEYLATLPLLPKDLI